MKPLFESTQGSILDWYKQRTAQLLDKVGADEVLSRNGFTLKKGGVRVEQISCPFHGTDKRPSARFFPHEADSPSHVWCYVCHERWDAIGLWRKFNGVSDFKEVLSQMERLYGVKPPEQPKKQNAVLEDPVAREVLQLFQHCENKLRAEKKAIGLESHLRLCQLMDQLWAAHDTTKLTPAEMKTRLTAVKNRIGEKIRAAKTSD